MTGVRIFKDASVSISVTDGDPPTDQTDQINALNAQVAALTGQVNTLTQSLAAVTANRDSLTNKINAAKAALA